LRFFCTPFCVCTLGIVLITNLCYVYDCKFMLFRITFLGMLFKISIVICILHIESDSVARGPKLLSMYTVEKRGFLVRKYWQTGSFKTCQTAFRTEFGERRAPSKCCIPKLVKMLETRGSRSNDCRLLSLGPIEGQSVQKYTPHNRTTQRR